MPEQLDPLRRLIKLVDNQFLEDVTKTILVVTQLTQIIYDLEIAF